MKKIIKIGAITYGVWIVFIELHSIWCHKVCTGQSLLETIDALCKKYGYDQSVLFRKAFELGIDTGMVGRWSLLHPKEFGDLVREHRPEDYTV